MQNPDLGLPVPDWLGVIRVARDWGISPSAVLNEPAIWVNRQLALNAADDFVRAERAKQKPG